MALSAVGSWLVAKTGLGSSARSPDAQLSNVNYFRQIRRGWAFQCWDVPGTCRARAAKSAKWWSGKWPDHASRALKNIHHPRPAAAACAAAGRWCCIPFRHLSRGRFGWFWGRGFSWSSGGSALQPACLVGAAGRYSMLRSSASGLEIGLPGRMSAGLSPPLTPGYLIESQIG